MFSKIFKRKDTTNISKLKVEINKIILEFKNILNSINDNNDGQYDRNNILIEIEKLEKDISISFEKKLENTISNLSLINKQIFSYIKKLEEETKKQFDNLKSEINSTEQEIIDVENSKKDFLPIIEKNILFIKKDLDKLKEEYVLKNTNLGINIYNKLINKRHASKEILTKLLYKREDELFNDIKNILNEFDGNLNNVLNLNILKLNQEIISQKYKGHLLLKNIPDADLKFSSPIIKINQTGYILNSSLVNSIEKERDSILDYRQVQVPPVTMSLLNTIKNIISKSESKPEPKVNKQQYFVINLNVLNNSLNNIFLHIKKIIDVTIEHEVKNQFDSEIENFNKLISEKVLEKEKEIKENEVFRRNKISICEDRFNILELLKIINDRVKQRIEKCSFVLKEENAK
ncbi:MAG: hypothetical protein RBR70_10875 [Arcobacter sp.]|jgi:hypothetical protein|uniref:hypothetical protein n=1 Tax=Arcobacter sp. TaxID=1872629 RepID=UPI002A751847|nr:hypothetical protein [Arcobacter sp.]MDY3205562.1 hypothetical protein [Arcobacter sp.]